MSIKKSQAILKHFIDLKFSVWFTQCSENTYNIFQVDCRLSTHQMTGILPCLQSRFDLS